MNSSLIRIGLGLIVTGLCIVSVAGAEERMLFDFTNEQAPDQWQTVNDGVMGGRSDGQFDITDEHQLRFFGTLSLENNGGFASVRSRKATVKLRSGDTIVIRLRGDGREYNLNLYTTSRQTAFSYRTRCETQKDEWIEVRLPLTDFVATAFGRPLENRPLNPADIAGIGFLIADEQAGPFELQVDWLKVMTADGESAERSGEP